MSVATQAKRAFMARYYGKVVKGCDRNCHVSLKGQIVINQARVDKGLPKVDFS